MTSREEATATSDRTVVVARVFDAPRGLVFRAWTDPELMAQWFAPEPLTVPRAEIDLRVGGRFTLVMRDDDGNEFPSTGEYLEVVVPERYVATDSVEMMPKMWLDTVNEARGKSPGIDPCPTESRPSRSRTSTARPGSRSPRSGSRRRCATPTSTCRW